MATVLDLGGGFIRTAQELAKDRDAHTKAITTHLIPAIIKQFGTLVADTASGIIKTDTRDHFLNACLHVLGWPHGELKSFVKVDLENFMKIFGTRISIYHVPGTTYIRVIPTKDDESFTTHGMQILSVVDKTLMPIAGHYHLEVPNTARYMKIMDFVEKTFPGYRLIQEDSGDKYKSRFIMRSADNLLTMHIVLESRKYPTGTESAMVNECWLNYVVVHNKQK